MQHPGVLNALVESEPLEALSRYLLGLQRLAVQVAPSQLQRAALDQLRAFLPFDSAIWGHGALGPEGVLVHAVFLYEQPEVMMAEYEHLKEHDTLAFQSLLDLGRTFNTPPSSWPEALHPAMRRHIERYGMIHTLSTTIADPNVGLLTSAVLYRAALDRPFTEAERAFKQALTPHLVEAWSANRLRFLDRPAAQTGPSAQAICDGAGVLHNVGPGFADLLRTEWPDWCGPRLPEVWLAQLRGRHHRWASGRALVAEVTPLHGLFHLDVRAQLPLDRLTKRELEIARAFGGGESYRELAARLELAPATVRNHLQAIYAKLGITSKVELALMVRAEPRAQGAGTR